MLILICISSLTLLGLKDFNSVSILIDEDGVVHVTIDGYVSEGVNVIQLPTPPIEVSIECYVDNSLVPIIYINRTLIVPSNTSGKLLIKYIANVTEYDGRFIFTIANNVEVSLRIKPGIALFTIPENISEVKILNGDLVITFKGPAKIEYSVLKYTKVKTETVTTKITTTSPQLAKILTTTTPTQPLTKTTTPTLYTTPTKTIHTTSIITSPKAPTKVGISVYYLIIPLIIIVVAVVVLIIRRKRSTPEGGVFEELDDLDRAILRKLEELNGTALQSELYKYFPQIPKVTFWRHVRKLARLNFIEIVKEGRVNKLILRKRLK